VKQLRRGAFNVAHPLEAAGFATENAIVGAARGGKRRRRAPSARTAQRITAPAAATAPADVYRKVEVSYLPGSYEIPVAGLEHYAEAVRETIAAVTAGAEPDAILIREPGNPYDRNAVGVHMAGGQVGHVPRDIAAVLAPALGAASASSGRLNGCPARIVTGYGSPQIVLTIDIAELGIDPASLR
jgi:hypothetical protein